MEGDLCLYTQIFPRAQGDALPIPRRHSLPQITNRMPHDHRLPPPRGPRAQVGPLLTGRGVWAFACLHYLPMRAEQGYAQKKSDVCVCKQLFWKLKMGILQTTGKVRFNLRGCGIDTIAGSRYIPHLWRCQRWHQTPAILALQCWSAQARFFGSPPPSAMQVYEEKTPGECSHTLRQRDFALWFKNSESLLNTRQHFQSTKPTVVFSFYCRFLVQPSWAPCSSLSIPVEEHQPSWAATAPAVGQHPCKTPDFSSWYYKLVVSAFNLFLNAPGKCTWTSTELALSAHKVAAKVVKQCLLSHISEGDKLCV